MDRVAAVGSSEEDEEENDMDDDDDAPRPKSGKVPSKDRTRRARGTTHLPSGSRTTVVSGDATMAKDEEEDEAEEEDRDEDEDEDEDDDDDADKDVTSSDCGNSLVWARVSLPVAIESTVPLAPD